MATKTTQLEKLRQVEVTERQRARDSETAAQTAKLTAEQTREQLIEAHASGAGIKNAEKARANALAETETATIRAEAAKRRADRADRDRQAFEAEHARDLIAELEPAATEAAERLQRAAADLLAADAEWFAIRQQVADLLSATPGASAANDLADSHSLAELARLLRRASIEVAPPLPHYRGLEHHEAEREHVTELRQRREEAA